MSIKLNVVKVIYESNDFSIKDKISMIREINGKDISTEELKKLADELINHSKDLREKMKNSSNVIKKQMIKNNKIISFVKKVPK